MFKTRKQAIDLLQAKTYERLAHEAAALECKEEQKAIEEWLIKDFTKCNITGAEGTVWTVHMVHGMNPILEDFGKVWGYATKHVDGALFYRRLNNDTVKARFGSGIAIPGVGWEPYTKIHHRSK